MKLLGLLLSFVVVVDGRERGAAIDGEESFAVTHSRSVAVVVVCRLYALAGREETGETVFLSRSI